MNKKLLAIVGGAGVATGVLLAPDKGSRTIKKLAGKGKKMLDSARKTANGEIESVKKSIQSKVDDVKQAIRKRARAVTEATLEAEENVHRKLRNALRTASKATGNGTEKKTATRNGVAKRKSVRAGKPSRLKKAVTTRASKAAYKSNGRAAAKKRSARATK